MVMLRLLPVFLALLLLIGCDEQKGPYLSFAGGGFVVNYRIGEMYYGFVAKPERKLPEGSVIEARFEDPAGGAEIVVDTPVRSGQLQYMFRTPPLKGVKKDKEYRVEMRLLDKPQGTVLASLSRSFRSTADQSAIPDKPLVVGPGYMPNPENDITKRP
jgi:hypothetical protein